jgi:hypoxanthine-DNA glycosylase
VCGFFGESIPETVEGKKDFLLRRHIALWDVVTSCEIVGSQDSTIKNYQIADIAGLASRWHFKAIICNGSTAYKLFLKHVPDLNLPVYPLPSTSPANTRFDEKEWYDALRAVFKGA